MLNIHYQLQQELDIHLVIGNIAVKHLKKALINILMILLFMQIGKQTNIQLVIMMEMYY